MRIVVALLVLTSAAAAAQDRRVAPDSAPFLLRVRAADTTQTAEMNIAMSGAAFASLGAVKEHPGSVSLGPGSKGTGTGTVMGSLFHRAGRLTFESRVPALELELTIAPAGDAGKQRLVARGRTVSVAYNEQGELSVATKP